MSDRPRPPAASVDPAAAVPDSRPALGIPADATLAGYDRWAEGYDATDNPMVAATAWALRTDPLDVAGRHLVELGSGTGRHAALALAGGAARFTGVDGSTGMLAVATRACRDPRVHWHTADVTATGLPAGCCDRLLVALVLEHLPDVAPLCREAARLAAPGAVLRVLEIHPDLIASGTGAHFVRDGVEHRFTSFAHPVATLVAALAAAGFPVANRREVVADGELLAAVPRLAKHRGRRVLVDLTAHRGPFPPPVTPAG